MNSPVTIGLQEKETVSVLETSKPDVTVRLLDEANLPELQKMLELNRVFFNEGGVITSGLYKMIEEDVKSDDKRPVHRMGIWKGDKLVGFVSTDPTDDSTEANPRIEVSYGIDKYQQEYGIATAAVRAVVEYEEDSGHTVVAEVQPNNTRSIRLLGKLGFKKLRYDEGQDRIVYER